MNLKELLVEAIQERYDTDGHEIQYGKDGCYGEDSGVLLNDAISAVEACADKYKASQISASTKANHLRVKELEDELSSLKENFYMMPKDPCIAIMFPFITVPSVVAGEYTNSEFYHEWAKDWSNWPNNK